MPRTTYLDRQGREIPRSEWEQLRCDPAYLNVAQWQNCRQTVDAMWLGVGPPHIPRHVFALQISGGKWDGQIVHTSTEQSLMHLFYATKAALKAQQMPLWVRKVDIES